MIKDLKQYIEKELHARRFLTEGLELVEAIEGAQGELNSLTKDIQSLKASIDKLGKDKAQAVAETADALGKLEAANKEVREVYAKADANAAQVLSDAREKAAALVAAAQAEVDAIKAEGEAQAAKKAALTKEVAELAAAKALLDSQINDIRSKFS